jgi:hypothetical protein
MNNNKQSSVELFAIALYEKGFLQGNGNKIDDLLEQAEAMHKEEIEEAWNSAYGGDSFHDGEDYYNETFNTKKR